MPFVDDDDNVWCRPDELTENRLLWAFVTETALTCTDDRVKCAAVRMLCMAVLALENSEDPLDDDNLD